MNRSYRRWPTITCCQSGTGRCSSTMTVGVAADLAHPLAELLGVADRGRQRDQPHRLGQVDDHLFPDRAAEAVGQVVHLVHDDVAEPGQGGRAGVEHVAQHLGRHDDDRGLAVDAVVAGQQADLGRAVALDQVVVLLVGQRLDRGGVEALAALLQGEVDRELADDGLAGPGGRRDEDSVARLQRPAGVELEVVELEVVQTAERGERRPALGLALTEGGSVPLGSSYPPPYRYRDSGPSVVCSAREVIAGTVLRRAKPGRAEDAPGGIRRERAASRGRSHR